VLYLYFLTELLLQIELQPNSILQLMTFYNCKTHFSGGFVLASAYHLGVLSTKIFWITLNSDFKHT